MPQTCFADRPALLLFIVSLALAACSPLGPEGEAVEALTTPPTLYSDPQRQSPVSAEPGEPLILPGVNLSTLGYVVYALQSNTQLTPVYPGIPSSNTSTSGAVRPLRVDANAVTVALPAIMTPNQSYAIWYVNQTAAGKGSYIFTPSSPVLVNDARPMWISPGLTVAPDGGSFHAYASQPRPGLTRDIKIIGRNLQPGPNSQTSVSFTPQTGFGGSPFTVWAQTTANDLAVQPYVIRATLPSIQPGIYTVKVSRDGTSSVPLPSPFFVRADPSTNATVTVSGCTPNDGIDDTSCIAQAITSATNQHQSSGQPVDVLFPAGTWNLDDAVGTLTVPQWINLTGPSPSPSGAPLATVVVGSASVLNQFTRDHGFVPRTTACNTDNDCGPTNNSLISCENGQCQYDCHKVPCTTGQCLTGSSGGYCLTPPPASPPPSPAPTCDNVSCPSHYTCIQTNGVFGCEATKEERNIFVLQGNNVVENLHFTSTWAVPLAVVYDVQIQPIDYTFVAEGDHITFTNDAFDGDYLPIFSDQLPSQIETRDLVITNSTISGWFQGFSALGLIGSVISGNRFLPGGFSAHVGGSTDGTTQVEVSDNTFDGATNTFTGSPNQFGFRAAWFFNSILSNEQVLLSNNTIDCVGTRLNGDQGEAIGFDANGSVVGFLGAQLLTSASPSPNPSPTTTVLTLPAAAINPGESDFTQGKWVSVVAGPGLGESRKIVGASNQNGILTLWVAPPFDVPLTVCTTQGCMAPSPSPFPAPSRIQISTPSWQVYQLHNTVDNRTSCVAKVVTTNAGQMGFYDTSFDSVIANNLQYDTVGLSMAPSYLANTTLKASYANVFSGNLINNPDFENCYDATSPFKGGGIIFTFDSQTPSGNGVDLPTYEIPAFNNIISHNQLENAGLWSQATPDYFTGLSFFGQSRCGNQCSTLNNPPGLLDTLIYRNTLGMATPSPAPGTAGIVVENDPTVDPPAGTFVCSDNTVSGPPGTVLAVGNTLQCQ
jgi:hypothetical protein